MKLAALYTLLPLIAALPPITSAHPTSHSSHSDAAPSLSYRKTLNFGASHPHASYHVPVTGDQLAVEAEAGLKTRGLHDVFSVARHVVESRLTEVLGRDVREGESYYVREDSYTDERTQITHVYVRQLINGLEVGDGDINISIDADGKVVAFGNSFYQGAVPELGLTAQDIVESNKAHRTSRQCRDLLSLVAAQEQHKSELLKLLPDLTTSQLGKLKKVLSSGIRAASQVIFGSETHLAEWLSGDDDQDVLGGEKAKLREQVETLLMNAEQQLQNMQHHVEVLCLRSPNSSYLKNVGLALGEGLPFHPAGDAFVSLLHHLSPTPEKLPTSSELRDKLSIHHSASLLPTQAPAEPPLITIAGLPDERSGGVVNGQVNARLMYQQADAEEEDKTELKLVWRYEVEMTNNWYEASVAVDDLQVVHVVDWASDAPSSRTRDLAEATKSKKGGKQKPLPAPPSHSKPFSYGVFPWGINDPEMGNQTTERAPWDVVASPAGWHSFSDKSNTFLNSGVKGMKTGLKTAFGNFSVPAGLDGTMALVDAQGNNRTTESWTMFETTGGNNVFAHEDWEGQSNWLHNWRPLNSSMMFDYEYGEYDGLRPKEYIDMAVTQLFYTTNMYHDLLYRLGFDEVSGNFQMDNFGKGGRGGDAVIANAQDAYDSASNNANFMTPPDGQQGRMRMYIWNTHTPYRDGDVEAGIVIHELTHGTSTRLTGGPLNSGCLGFGEAGGMGEGWGDFFATVIRQVTEHANYDKDHSKEVYSMGAWAANTPKGIRNYRYSTNDTVNPSTYKTLDRPGYWGVHAIGEVWAEFLFVMEELLIMEHGFSKTLFPPVDPTKPNDYYRGSNATAATFANGKPKPRIPKHGNTLALQLVVDGMKLQPCRPS
ncbi:hypothetical protein QFC19_001073 [Naganishia cerealis]|uniref:Uncharacterized protein n=1 Tax=Naganishia cerealis TaxID=610337 RepID=A0ACC2WIZ1_9TREE|nr:hypothetical protein QFC19_001073 [Naganishia cerealis]